MFNPSRNYLRELDVIRFWAFFGVFLYHGIHVLAPSGPMAFHEQVLWHATFIVQRAGMFGVDMFFTLSAFLITTLLLAEREATGQVQLRKFYARRILRIWPLYFGVALLVFGVAWLLEEKAMAPYFWPFMLMAPNWAWIAHGTPVVQVHAFTALMVFWSLGIEEQFYILWPILLRAVSPRRIRLLAWGMLALAAFTRWGCVALDLHPLWVYANTFARLDPIAAGILLAAEWNSLRDGDTASRLRYRILGSRLTLAAGVLGFLAAGWLWINASVGSLLTRNQFNQIGLPLVAWSGYLILFNTLLNQRPEDSRGRVFGALAYLGKISFGLYVYHGFVLGLVMIPVQATYRITGPYASLPYVPMLISTGIGLPLTILVAHLSYKYFESPFLAMKRRFSTFAAAPGPAA